MDKNPTLAPTSSASMVAAKACDPYDMTPEEELAYQKRLEEQSLRELLARNRPAAYQRYGQHNHHNHNSSGSKSSHHHNGGTSSASAVINGGGANGGRSSSKDAFRPSSGGGGPTAPHSSNYYPFSHYHAGSYVSGHHHHSTSAVPASVHGSTLKNGRFNGLLNNTNNTTAAASSSSPTAAVPSPPPSLFPIVGTAAANVTNNSQSLASGHVDGVVVGGGGGGSAAPPPSTSTSLPPNRIAKVTEKLREREADIQKERERREQQLALAGGESVEGSAAGAGLNQNNTANTNLTNGAGGNVATPVAASTSLQPPPLTAIVAESTPATDGPRLSLTRENIQLLDSRSSNAAAAAGLTAGADGVSDGLPPHVRGTTFSTILQEFVAESMASPAAAAAVASVTGAADNVTSAQHVLPPSAALRTESTVGSQAHFRREGSEEPAGGYALHHRRQSGANNLPPLAPPLSSSSANPRVSPPSMHPMPPPHPNVSPRVSPSSSHYHPQNQQQQQQQQQPRAWINFPRSRMRAYFGDTPWESLHAQPTLVVGFLATAFIMICTYIMQHYVLEIKDHLGLFAMGSYVNFSSYYVVYFYLEKYSTSFRKISQDKKFYTISNIIKASMLAAITPFAVKHLYLIVVHDSWDTSTLRNLGCVYSIPDFVSLLTVRRMSNTTIFHHVCVVVFNYFSLQNDYGKENVCRCIVVYAAFSTFAYVVNMLLASRFLGVSGRVSRFLALLALAVYVFCCAVNWSWQVHYLRTLILNHDHWSIYVYMILICFVMWDDIVLNRWLLQNFRNTSGITVLSPSSASMLVSASTNALNGNGAAAAGSANSAAGLGLRRATGAGGSSHSMSRAR